MYKIKPHMKDRSRPIGTDWNLNSQMIHIGIMAAKPIRIMAINFFLQ
jgi:hypothetical protein